MYLLQYGDNPRMEHNTWTTVDQSDDKDYLLEAARKVNKDHEDAVQAGHSVDFISARVVLKGHENDSPCEHCWA